MRNSVYIGLILILFGLIGVGVKFNLELEDFKNQTKVERTIQDKKIEELEKEVRILKQDVLILEYGFIEE